MKVLLRVTRSCETPVFSGRYTCSARLCASIGSRLDAVFFNQTPSCVFKFHRKPFLKSCCACPKLTPDSSIYTDFENHRNRKIRVLSATLMQVNPGLGTILAYIIGTTLKAKPWTMPRRIGANPRTRKAERTRDPENPENPRTREVEKPRSRANATCAIECSLYSYEANSC